MKITIEGGKLGITVKTESDGEGGLDMLQVLHVLTLAVSKVQEEIMRHSVITNKVLSH